MSNEQEEEGRDVVFGAMVGSLPISQRSINQIWQQTPLIKEPSESRGFITQSPFSFKKPIFFSVPRDNAAKKVKLKQAKRQLFGCNQEPALQPKPEPKKVLTYFEQPAEDQNDFARFV